MFDKIINVIIDAITDKHSKQHIALSDEELAEFLNTTKDALEAAYNKTQTKAIPSGKFSARPDAPVAKNLVGRIVNELLDQTEIWSYDRKSQATAMNKGLLPSGKTAALVTKDDIQKLPEECRPQLTGSFVTADIPAPSSPVIFWNLKKFMDTGDDTYYYMFRQGLDILDLDPLTYETLGCNRNSMGNWLPQLVAANAGHSFFKIPSTKIMKMPMPLLQLTRQPYEDMTSTTTAIVNDFVFKAFDLDENKDYFVKTGTHSSKFDFRNAHIHDAKEVHELGDYLLFVHFKALQMASPLATPCMVGASTTNEWVVREFIEDKENNPTIYHGRPLHTEFRVFVDCDSNEVLSVENYWKPEVMTARFAESHSDGITYAMNKEKLCKRYEDNKQTVCDHIAEILPGLNLSGQWSIDIMMNGDDFWLIDMAVAEESTYYESVPENKRVRSEENWIPKLPQTIEQ